MVKPLKRPKRHPKTLSAEQGESLEHDYQRARFAGTVEKFQHDPESAAALVAQLSDKQVRDWLTTCGSTTAARRSIEENRAFLTQLLPEMTAESYPVPGKPKRKR